LCSPGFTVLQNHTNQWETLLFCSHWLFENGSSLCLWAVLWSWYSNLRLRLQLRASNFFCFDSIVLRFLALAPEQFGPENRKNIVLFVLLTWTGTQISVSGSPPSKNVRLWLQLQPSKFVRALAPAPQPCLCVDASQLMILMPFFFNRNCAITVILYKIRDKKIDRARLYETTPATGKTCYNERLPYYLTRAVRTKKVGIKSCAH